MPELSSEKSHTVKAYLKNGFIFRDKACTILHSVKPDFKFPNDIIIPSSTIEVEDRALDNLSGTYNSITFPASISVMPPYLFTKRNVDIKTLILKDGFQIISDAVFRSAPFVKVILPDTLTEIGREAFKGCENLEDINLEHIKKIGKEAFAESGLKKVKLSSNIEDTEGFIFDKCNKLEEAEVNCACNMDYAFSSCKTLKKVTFGEHVKKIYHGMFSFCKSLETVNIPSNIKTIGKEAFRNSGLTSITVPGTCKLVEGIAFNGCKNLEEIIFENGVEMIGRSVIGFTSVTSVTIPKSVYKIAPLAFANAKKLKEIKLETLSTVIPNSFAIHCTDLEKINFENIKSISENAFQDTAFTSLKLGNIKVKAYAFAECSKLKEIYLEDRCIVAPEAFVCCNNVELVCVDNLFGKMSFMFGSDYKSYRGLYKKEEQKFNKDMKIVISKSVPLSDSKDFLEEYKDLTKNYFLPDLNISSKYTLKEKAKIINFFNQNKSIEEITAELSESSFSFREISKIITEITRLRS